MQWRDIQQLIQDNFEVTMKSKRISTILNVIGMSVSLMVFRVLFAQVWFDFRFNSNFEGSGAKVCVSINK